ncbi:hypothetical protein [Paracoccus sp. SCSIO 75233]|uniref:hypothetical protein n=1 Tax=Paracoccus sp. SCSIO 75233 TaxID=3017782 RepID=UPI0022F11455|nr:hypothetical protein [Paracoccus sp. SCSIO 75233]WBU53953.1 hypothetical protein PAF12_03705 [Paracoccus sp. SCSIO 75233]
MRPTDILKVSLGSIFFAFNLCPQMLRLWAAAGKALEPKSTASCLKGRPLQKNNAAMFNIGSH